MLPSCVVKPETDRLTLTNGHWLLVRRRLNTGEERDGFGRALDTHPAAPCPHCGHTVPGGVVVNPMKRQVAMLTSYLLDWSLCDDQGETLTFRDSPVSPPNIPQLEAHLRAIEPDIFEEIRRLITDHEAAQTQARADQKKTHAGAPNSAAISNSPSAPAGVLMSSAH